MPPSNINHKRQKLYNSRVIRNELSEKSFTNPTAANTSVITMDTMGNKLDVPSFLKSREFEIESLQRSQLKSKYSSATRVFQALPRELRRRTASHNVRRIPKRMRPRALKEMGLSARESGKETKGVAANGRPLKKKHPRGRLLYHLRRREKLLKYAAKHKLSGHLIEGELVDIKGMDVRGKLKMIRAQIADVEQQRELPEEKFPDTFVGKEQAESSRARGTLNNLVGAYDNTAVNERAGIHRVSSLHYATRQTRFKWLPTHVWHAKRAKMVKRWGWSLAQQPTAKCFRKTSRSWRVKGAIAWDTSYLNAFVVASRDSRVLEDCIGELTRGQAVKNVYRSGRRAWEGLLYVAEEPQCVGHVLWLDTKVVVRVHPSVYETVFGHLLEIAQKNPESVYVEDCRYSLGSISVGGPKALSALQSIFHSAEPASEAYQLWRKVAGVHDITTIPTGSCFCFAIDDPRLWNKPQTGHTTQSADAVLDCVVEIGRGGAVDRTALDRLFSIAGRTACYQNQQSLKQLGKRHTAARSGQPVPRTANDSSFPVCVVKQHNMYTVVLPWFWVLPVWHQLVHVPHVMLGGLRQLHQVAYENSRLAFEDLAFTRQGFAEGDVRLREAAQKWARMPRSRQVRYERLELGPSNTGELLSPFGCDWRGLQVLRYALRRVPKDADNSRVLSSEFDTTLRRVIRNNFDAFEMVAETRKADADYALLHGNEPLYAQGLPVVLADRLPQHTVLPSAPSLDSRSLPALPVRAVRVHCTAKGHLTDNARLYRVPADQRDVWRSYAAAANRDVRGRALSTQPAGVPGNEHLVGLATSATFNLAQGQGSGVGFVDAAAVDVQRDEYLLARNVGSDVCYVCKWEVLY